MKSKLLFLAKLAAVSLILTLVKDYAALAYQLPLYGLLLPVRDSLTGLPYDSALRLIPLVALLLATPGASVKKRLLLLGAGMAIYLVMDTCSTLLWKGMPPRNAALAPSEAHITYSLFWEALGHWVLPISIWAAGMHREIADLLKIRQMQICSGMNRLIKSGSPVVKG